MSTQNPIYSNQNWRPLKVRDSFQFVRGNISGFAHTGSESGTLGVIGPNSTPGAHPDVPFVIGVYSAYGAAAQPGNLRAVDSELLFNYPGSTSITVNPTGIDGTPTTPNTASSSIVAVRGAITIGGIYTGATAGTGTAVVDPSRTTPTTIVGSSYLYGVQGKVVLNGGLANTGGNGIIVTGLQGQLDISHTTVISSPLTAGWFDIGASASAALIASWVPGSATGLDAQLGVAAKYGILAAAGITNTGSTVVAAPAVIGSFPTTTITFDGGTATVDNIDAAAAQVAAHAAYLHYSGLAFTSLGGALDLSTAFSGSNIVTPGNYSFGAATCSLGLVLNGPGTYIFKGSSTINLASGQSITFSGGATLANTTVIWLVGSSFTSVATSNMVGTILADTSITLEGGTLQGRAFAGVVTSSGAVTIAAANNVTVSFSPPTPATGGPTFIDITTLYNTTAAVINSAFRIISNSTFLFDLSSNSGSPWLTTGVLSSQTKKIAVNVDGVTYYIPLYAA
jgi:hypothetical protein